MAGDAARHGPSAQNTLLNSRARARSRAAKSAITRVEQLAVLGQGLDVELVAHAA
ncbi:hypothetical protein ACQEUU_20160 [Nonomuraea sp. CA-218870]|uniref:hypothetical protein n=1 Tax=Nonomuraea sp. CA-218870 TaxID=3239998 RepID=UPI003D90BB69